MQALTAPRALRRTQPPIVSTASAHGFRSALRAIGDAQAARERLSDALQQRFGASRVLLTDSGTSALVLALRTAAGRGGTAALPAYSCVDLMAAAVAADVRVRLYDLDPATLNPDLESLEAALRRGADAVVVAYLFGYPADIAAVTTLAAAHGATVIEDAAQAAAGTLNGRLLGGWGPLTVLSFGRGKGVSGGGGGALLAFDDAAGNAAMTAADARLRERNGGVGWRALGVTAAQWLLARPALYAIPSALPFLRLGETVYHPAHDPMPIAACSSGLAADALARADEEARAREVVALKLSGAAGGATGIACIAGGHPGYLRLPVRRPGLEPSTRLGILRGYPATLADYDIVRHVLHEGEAAGPGAVALRESLFTLPTHHHVRDIDIARSVEWLHGRSRT